MIEAPTFQLLLILIKLEFLNLYLNLNGRRDYLFFYRTFMKYEITFGFGFSSCAVKEKCSSKS